MRTGGVALFVGVGKVGEITFRKMMSPGATVGVVEESNGNDKPKHEEDEGLDEEEDEDGDEDGGGGGGGGNNDDDPLPPGPAPPSNCVTFTGTGKVGQVSFGVALEPRSGFPQMTTGNTGFSSSPSSMQPQGGYAADRADQMRMKMSIAPMRLRRRILRLERAFATLRKTSRNPPTIVTSQKSMALGHASVAPGSKEDSADTSDSLHTGKAVGPSSASSGDEVQPEDDLRNRLTRLECNLATMQNTITHVDTKPVHGTSGASKNAKESLSQGTDGKSISKTDLQSSALELLSLPPRKTLKYISLTFFLLLCTFISTTLVKFLPQKKILQSSPNLSKCSEIDSTHQNKHFGT